METWFVSVTQMPRTSETDICRHVSLQPGKRLVVGDPASVGWCGWKPGGVWPVSNIIVCWTF